MPAELARHLQSTWPVGTVCRLCAAGSGADGTDGRRARADRLAPRHRLHSDPRVSTARAISADRSAASLRVGWQLQLAGGRVGERVNRDKQRPLH